MLRSHYIVVVFHESEITLDRNIRLGRRSNHTSRINDLCKKLGRLRPITSIVQRRKQNSVQPCINIRNVDSRAPP